MFLAEQIQLGNRLVAIKVLRHQFLEEPDFLQRFRDEAASTARIRHTNVVTVYEAGQSDDGSPYIAIEYLDGETLRQVLQKQGALPLLACIEILNQIARGLNAAHRLGIVHRDLKPDNVFITHDDDGKPLAKILDFGIAKMRESSTHTMTGLAVGTPAYMSVEQASGMRSEQLDGRSDIYSLGIVVYEMLTGRVPFDADTPLAYVRKHIAEPPLPPSSIRPDLQAFPGLESVVMKALAKDRDNRYKSAPEFAAEFAAAATRPMPAQVSAPTIRRAAAAAAPSQKLSKALIGLASAMAVLVLVAAMAWWKFKGPNSEAAKNPNPPINTPSEQVKNSAPDIKQNPAAQPEAPISQAPSQPLPSRQQWDVYQKEPAADKSGSSAFAKDIDGEVAMDFAMGTTRRVQFLPGESSASMEHTVMAGVRDHYLIRGSSGQVMSASVTSPTNAAIISVRGPDGQYLIPSTGTGSRTAWTDRLAQTGDFVLEVESTGGAAKYVLNVTIN